MTGDTHIKLEHDARGLATITLNRQSVHNAFDDEMITKLTERLVSCNQDPTIRVVLLASSGKYFSAGADINWMRDKANSEFTDNFADALKLAALMETLDSLEKPTIARVQGPAYGGGVGLIACCDVAIATPKASFRFSEVRLGLIPAVISPYVIRAIGTRQARRYFQTSELIDAQTAASLGLVHEVVPENKLDGQVASCVESLLAAGPHALKQSKNLIQIQQPKTDDLTRLTADMIARTRASNEGKEGVTAFLEKRRPDWQTNV